jgi:sortase A
MPDAIRTPSSKRGSRFLRWMAYLWVICGGAALGWCLAVMADAHIAQWLARERLESIPPATTSSAPATTLPAPSRAIPETGTPLAELSIPRIGLSVVVMEGSDEHTLRRGLGHIETTPLPGESGNVAIAGHRDSFFRPLRNIQVGDDIWLNTPKEPVHYRVSSFRVVNPTEVSVIDPTTDAVLTLVTCYPFYFVGSAPDRFIVRASLVRDGEQLSQQIR